MQEKSAVAFKKYLKSASIKALRAHESLVEQFNDYNETQRRMGLMQGYGPSQRHHHPQNSLESSPDHDNQRKKKRDPKLARASLSSSLEEEEAKSDEDIGGYKQEDGKRVDKKNNLKSGDKSEINFFTQDQ